MPGRQITLIALLGIGSTGALAATPVDLDLYVGAYPWEEVTTAGGRHLPPLLTLKTVRAAIRAAAPAGTDVVGRALDPDGPRTPVYRLKDRIHSWGCETHNCGANNWVVILAPDASAAEICHQDAGQVFWYGNGTGREMPEGFACPDKPDAPDQPEAPAD
ncbi:MAG: hypothetical protein CMO30_07115 [Tistrella sp.]|uniref:Uncharacterized protein n=1 Tax=Tistrella mobilis TaxID=171437 RepID=A0A3B9IKS1_9PROT|nr:hypothetical protein [Tistrella sp.]MAD37047.1 hypothetical protein [Tistrella sp.]MBA75038.1 hypothetical protein [Tistrella sp.]HAE48474.1 hypothetical protein [Tistrella mobilis]